MATDMHGEDRAAPRRTHWLPWAAIVLLALVLAGLVAGFSFLVRTSGAHDTAAVAAAPAPPPPVAVPSSTPDIGVCRRRGDGSPRPAATRRTSTSRPWRPAVTCVRRVET
jgi:hypothetical protein